MPRKKKPKQSYITLFFKVEEAHHYTGFSLAHDTKQTGEYFSHLLNMELIGTTTDWSTYAETPIELTAYKRDQPIQNERQLAKEVEARIDWRITDQKAREREQEIHTRMLEPKSIGFVEKRGGQLNAVVWIGSEAWHPAFQFALSGKPLYVSLTGRKEVGERFIWLNHFSFTTKPEG